LRRQNAIDDIVATMTHVHQYIDLRQLIDRLQWRLRSSDRPSCMTLRLLRMNTSVNSSCDRQGLQRPSQSSMQRRSHSVYTTWNLRSDYMCTTMSHAA